MKSWMITVCITGLLSFSCKKESPAVTCETKATAVVDALNAYVETPTKENCLSYVNALKDYVNSNACFDNAFYASYKKQLDEFSEADCE